MRHHGTALGNLASAVAVVSVLAGTIGRSAADQGGAVRPFGPDRCGPLDASYVRVTNATGGQVLPLGPTEVAAAAPLMAASVNAETVFWASATLASSAETIAVPVDGVTSRIAFVLSTDGRGAPLSAEIVVTAESATDPAAANSAIIRATLLDAAR